MKVKVDWYKRSTGKWYSGGVVDIGDAKLWRQKEDDPRSNEVAVAIGLNQEVMRKGATSSGDYFVVVQNLEEDPEADIPGNFCQHLFFGSDFPEGV